MKFESNENIFDRFMNDRNDFMLSNSVQLFEYSWKAFVNDWSPSNIPAVQYLERTLLVYKEKIVRCWTDQYLHFGTMYTSRGERSHAVVKKCPKIATGGPSHGIEKFESHAGNPIHGVERWN